MINGYEETKLNLGPICKVHLYTEQAAFVLQDIVVYLVEFTG